MRKVTLRDIADELDVHPSTVSRALDPDKAALVNAQTRKRVQEVAKQLGYEPDVVAAGLRDGRTRTLGIVVADLANPYISPVIRGIENNLESRGQMALIAETQDDHDRFRRVVESMMRRSVDAIITTAARSGDEALLSKTARKVPVVLAVRSLPGTGLPAVTHDDDRGGRIAAEHLVDMGARSLSQLRGPADISSFRQRADGFAGQAEELGVDLIEIDDSGAHPIISEGERLMRRLLDEVDDLPDGIFAHNDQMALGALDVMRSEGLRAPDDVLMIGYNNSPQTAYVEPALTTLTLPGYEVGRLAADVADMRIQDPQREAPTFSLPPKLVIRASTGAPPEQRTG